MKYSRTAIGLLSNQYRSVLKKCLLINLGLVALAMPVNAETFGSITVNGAGEVKGELIAGQIKTNGSVNANSLSVAGAGNVGGKFTAGDIETNNITSNGSGLIKGELAAGSVKTNGRVTAGSLQVNGAGTVQGELVAGAIRTSGGIKANTLTTTGAIDVAGGAKVGGDVEANSLKTIGAIDVGGAAKISGDTETSTIHVGGDKLVVNNYGETQIDKLIVKTDTQTQSLKVLGASELETLTVNGAGEVKGKFTAGQIETKGGISAGSFAVTGTGSVDGKFTAGNISTQSIETKAIKSTGAAEIGGELTAGSIKTKGGVTANSLSVAGAGSVLGKFTAGQIETKGGISAGSFAVTGSGSVDGKFTAGNISTQSIETKAIKSTGAAEIGGKLTAGSIETNGNITGNSLSVAGTAEIGGVAKLGKLTFNNEQKVGGIDVNAIKDGAGNQEVIATTASLGKTVGSFDNMSSKAITLKDNLTSAINSLANNVEKALGGAFDDNGWSATVDNKGSANYVYIPVTNVMDAVNQVAVNMGTKDDLGEGINGVSTKQSVNKNIAAVNSTIGDLKGLNSENQNLTNGPDNPLPTTVVGALNNLDATMGRIHGLAQKLTDEGKYQGNLAEGTTVEQHLTALDAAIGNREEYVNTNGSNGYVASSGKDVVTIATEIASNIGTASDLGTEMNGVSANNTVNANIASLNDTLGDISTLKQTHYASNATNVADAIKSVDTGLNRLDHDVRSLRSHFQAGMASAAALSALVPNARADGNTQLSLGTGAYRGHNAVALGGFHWINDNVLLNAGVAWDNTEATYRVGVTYSW